jgi:MraZ protein
MFLGTFEHSIDAKGRLFIPAKFRDADGNKEGKFILTQGMDQCLYLFSPQFFQENFASRLTSLPVKNQQDARAFKRLLLAGAQEVGLDDLGRILIPKPLLDYAGFKKMVSILGVGERVELWASVKWEKYQTQSARTFQRLGRHLEV